TVHDQISDALRSNLRLSKAEARERVVELLSLVGIPSPHKRLDSYVHEFSGGMRQRVMLAMALSCSPSLLIADEPTTALDVTIQATILELITGMIERLGMSLLFITHNLGVVAHACDKIGVMYASHVVELGDKREIFANPQHPYTVGLLNSIPRLDTQARYLTPIEGTVCNMMTPPGRCRHTARRQGADQALHPARRHLFEAGRREGAGAEGGRRHRLPHPQGRDAGPGGRERLRQVDDGAAGVAVDRSDGRLHHAARRGPAGVPAGAAQGCAQADPAGVPGPLQLAQSAQDDHAHF